jgi:5-methylcytosine-specific restriction endonuclease McrA
MVKLPSVKAYETSARRIEDNLFYHSPRWRRMRRLQLALHPLCHDCQARGRTTVAVQVHHHESRISRPDLAWEMNNLRSLCASCHARKPKAQRPPISSHKDLPIEPT